MLRPSSLRPALRSRALHSTRSRFASTGSGSNPQVETAQKKAQEVLASTQETASKAFESIKKAAGPLGSRAGNLLGSYKEPILYNFAVLRELGKQIYRAEGLAPPSLSTVQSAYRTLWANATSREFWQKAVSSGEIAKIGIYAVEAYGIFKIGEMVGRRSIVGYKLD